MKKVLTLLVCLAVILPLIGCGVGDQNADILATTAPVFEFTTLLCTGTGLTVDCLITENISCLHDYTLQTKQMLAIESADVVIISGAGLEDNFADILDSAAWIIDASTGITLLCEDDAHTHSETDGHSHAQDPHIWLSPENAVQMVKNIFKELSIKYPQYKAIFEKNQAELLTELNALSAYAEKQLSDLKTREIITFHDGFGYMAQAFDLHILHSIEEESGREASASELIHLCELVNTHHLPCIFTEKSGSVSAAQIISAETGTKIFSLDMAMSESNYFEAMYHNIDTLKEALG